jgi:hypothetical protein
LSSAGISGLLERLGFREDSIVEVIVTTLNPDDTVNPAPMGITRGKGQTLMIKPFKTSRTYRNLVENPNACINITSEPSYYLQTAFKDEKFTGLHKPRFRGLRLEQSDAYILLKRTDEREIDDMRAEFSFTIQGVETLSTAPRAFSRGEAAVIDAVIHATRIEAFIEQGKINDARKAWKQFISCRDVVNRVSKSEVMAELNKLVARWSVNL